MTTRRYRVPHEVAAHLLPGQLYRDGVIFNINIEDDKNCLVEVEVLHVARPIWDRLLPRSWRP